MPMIPEDIMTGLTTLSASDNMNQRQRDLMTEGAALIKFQQHCVREADKNKKAAEDHAKSVDIINRELSHRITEVLALHDYFRQQLANLSVMRLIPVEDTEA